MLAILAAAVPVGAIITLSDDGGGGTISTTQQNNAGGGMMVGALPTTRITSNNNGDGTISWTVTFGAGININAITESQFSTSDNAPITMFSRTGNSVTFVSTHTADGSITLRYTGALAMMQTSSAVALTVPPRMPTPGEVGILAGIPETALSATLIATDNSATITSGRTIQRMAGTANNFVISLGTTASPTSYTFASGDDLDSGQIVDDSNTLLVRQFATQDEGMTNAVAYLMYSGTNVDGTGTGNTAITHVDYFYNAVNQRPNLNETSVNFAGDYVVAAVPASGEDFNSQTYEGTFSFTVDFTDRPGITALSNGITRDSNMNQTGTLTGGAVVNGRLISANFTGMADSDLAGFSGGVAGNFYDENTFAARGALSRTESGTTTPAILGLFGTRQNN